MKTQKLEYVQEDFKFAQKHNLQSLSDDILQTVDQVSKTSRLNDQNQLNSKFITLSQPKDDVKQSTEPTQINQQKQKPLSQKEIKQLLDRDDVGLQMMHMQAEQQKQNETFQKIYGQEKQGFNPKHYYSQTVTRKNKRST